MTKIINGKRDLRIYVDDQLSEGVDYDVFENIVDELDYRAHKLGLRYSDDWTSFLDDVDVSEMAVALAEKTRQ